MFITRFTLWDDSSENYYYHTQREAEDHLLLFEGDDSGLYRNIAVLEEGEGMKADTVLVILTFTKDGRKENLFRVRDVVRFADAWTFCPEEAEERFVILNLNETRPAHAIVGSLTTTISLGSTHSYGLEMLTLAD